MELNEERTASRARSRRQAAGLAGLLAVALASGATAVAGPASAAQPSAAQPSAAQHGTSPSGSYVVRGTGSLPALQAAVHAAGGHVTRSLAIIGAVAAELPRGGADTLRHAPGVGEVTADAPVQLAASSYDATADPHSAFSSALAIGARTVVATGLTGAGVDVALVDSGVDPVPGLGKIVNGPDLTEESQDPTTAHVDSFGHGTHLAGLIAGRDSTSAGKSGPSLAGDSADFLGLAPDARIVSVKVADAHGQSDVSQVVAGIDWVVQHAHTDGLNVRVLNLSFGTDSAQPYQLDPLAYAAEQAWRHGIVVVVSVGNGGTSLGRLTDPAIDPYVLAVGAVDTAGTATAADDRVADFSNRGDGVRNPDLVAPGAGLQSLRAPGSSVDKAHASSPGLDARFLRGSGTSQAAAVTSGAVALLLQRFPLATPDMVKAALIGSAHPLPGTPETAQGSGVLDVQAALPLVMSRAVQRFPRSTGTGTIEGSRGSYHFVAPDGSVLTGERDLFGVPLSSSRLAVLEAYGMAWQGGVFNGSLWTGSGPGRGRPSAESSSSAWNSSAWASSAWASSAWASSAWNSSAWNSSAWASSAWNGCAWAGTAWAGETWE